jgi:hypothetical protein
LNPQHGLGIQYLRDLSMYLTYILECEINRTVYIGSTADLVDRLKRHNNGRVPSTRDKRPWRLLKSLLSLPGPKRRNWKND